MSLQLPWPLDQKNCSGYRGASIGPWTYTLQESEERWPYSRAARKATLTAASDGDSTAAEDRPGCSSAALPFPMAGTMPGTRSQGILARGVESERYAKNSRPPSVRGSNWLYRGPQVREPFRSHKPDSDRRSRTATHLCSVPNGGSSIGLFIH